MCMYVWSTQLWFGLTPACPLLIFPLFSSIIPTLSFIILQRFSPTVLSTLSLYNSLPGSALFPFFKRFTTTPSLHLLGVCLLFHIQFYAITIMVIIPFPRILGICSLFCLPLPRCLPTFSLATHPSTSSPVNSP